MAKSSTTHVIEIESGIGEPAFVPLTLGQELHPVSIGKKGMWRLESAGVLEVHAFVYFDGASLFMKSADEEMPASVDGYAIGKTWTELHAPCKIEVGGARLRYRALSAPASERAPRSVQREPESVAPISPRRIDEPVRSSRMPRPFKPGEFSNAPPRGESTRVSPLDSSSRPPSRVPERESPARLPTSDEWEDDARPTSEIDHVPMRPAPAPPEGTLAMGRPEVPPVMMVAPFPQTPGMMVAPFPQTPGAFGPFVPGPAPITGPPAFDPYGQAPPIGTESNNYGPGSHIGGAAPGPAPSYLAKFKELSPPQRLLVVLAPFCLLSAAYLLLFDDPRPAKVATDADAGAKVVAAASTQVVAQTPINPVAVTPVPPSCPPGFVPYSVPINGQIPCVPAGTPMPTPATAPPPPSSTPSGTIAPPPVTIAAPTTAKTLERQAVDYVAAGNYAAAAQVYDQLQRQNPNSRVYAEAARILRAKADAGIP